MSGYHADGAERAAVGRPSALLRAVRWIDRQAGRPSFYAKIAAFPLLDYAVPVLPNQMLLVALALLQRGRWLAIAATFVLASAAGAGAMAVVVQAVGGPLAGWLTANLDAAGRVFELIESNGTWGLAALALLPVPPRTGVLLCSLAGLPPASIMLAVGTGRVVPATAIAFAAARSPHVLRRWPGMRWRLDRLEALRSEGASV